MLQSVARLETKLLENCEQDLNKMEERLTASMKTIVNSSIQGALKNITSSITKAVAEDPEINKQKRSISQLQTENLRLTRKVHVLDSEYNKLKLRINTIEQKSLDHTLIIRGTVENQEETETSMKDSIFSELSETVVGETFEEKLNTARRMEIKRCKRIGHYNAQRARPISVELKYKEDVKYIMDNKSFLRHKIFIDHEYTSDIEQKRKLLLPILKTARYTEPYKGHCKMEDDKLVIRGRTYTSENLHQLPEDINCFKVTSKEDEHCLGFFGGLNPLSNFHTAPFTLDGIEYISSEQFIQAKKVEFFSDRTAYDRIMGSTTSLDCKKNSRLIRGSDRNKREGVAKQVCYPGIRAKFQQNADLLNTLLYKTGHKKIVESTNDRLWGTGIPLNKAECLDQSKWTGQGILGEILEEIRHEFRPSMPTIPPPGPVSCQFLLQQYHALYCCTWHIPPPTNTTSTLQPGIHHVNHCRSTPH